MTLAIVIPVWNDQTNLNRLIAQICQLNVCDQVIIVDDASDPAITVADNVIGPQNCPITLLRRNASGGAGAARNDGLTAVTSDHILFFDSDDLLTPEFPRLWRALQGKQFDFCLFRYHDSERGALGGWGQIPHDDARWQLAGAGQCALQDIDEAAKWILAEASNFPWNKIYNTQFLRHHGLRCTEIKVHNDIELHWNSFTMADRVLVSNRIAATHIVHTAGNRLTNRAGTERLDVFTALTQVTGRLSQAQAVDAAWLAFLRFTRGLLNWIQSVLDPELHTALREAARLFLSQSLPPTRYKMLTRQDPVLALQLYLRMLPDSLQDDLVPCSA